MFTIPNPYNNLSVKTKFEECWGPKTVFTKTEREGGQKLLTVLTQPYRIHYPYSVVLLLLSIIHLGNLFICSLSHIPVTVFTILHHPLRIPYNLISKDVTSFTLNK